MTSKIQMHPKPMVRHTSCVRPGTASISVALPADVISRSPGLYIQLRTLATTKGVHRDATQLLVFPMDQLDELETAIKALRAVTTE